MKPKWVYFMRPIGMLGPIKIGWSAVQENRLNGFMAWSPWPLEIFGRVPGSHSDEIFLHKCFADLHSHYEWFRAEPRLYAAINKIISENSVDSVRGELVPVGDIGRARGPKWTSDKRLQLSNILRAVWAERQRRSRSSPSGPIQ